MDTDASSLAPNSAIPPPSVQQRKAAAELAKIEAETAGLLADQELHEIEKAKLTAQARKAEVEAEEAERLAALVKASEYEHRIYVFNGEVSERSCATCMQHIGQWQRIGDSRPIKLVFNSPGGSVFDGLALFDFIQTIRKAGTRVDTEAIGVAASMGGVLLQAGECRTMSPNSHLLIHEVSHAAIGSMSELEDSVEFTKRLQDRLLTILSSRSNMSKDDIKVKWARRDWWLDAETALELGFCDVVA